MPGNAVKAPANLTSSHGFALLVALTAAFSWRPGAAHDEPHDTITAVTREIDAEPSEADRYLRRGELQRRQSQWELAIQDFEKARELGADDDTVNLYIGRTWLYADDPKKALKFLNAFIATHPDNVGGRTLRARTFAALGQHESAAADLEIAISASHDKPTPDLLIETAQQLVAGAEPDYAKAIATLKMGLSIYGPNVALIDEAITINLENRDFAGALAMMDELPATLRDSPAWLMRRGDIQTAAGNDKQALETYATAMRALENLPGFRRSLPANTELEKALKEKLAPAK